MSSSPAADADSINAQLAEFLCARKEEMIRTWIGRVRADSAILSESLTTNQLRNHLPQLFDDLAAILRCYGSAGALEQTERDGEKHGLERWQQGFSLIELLREIMHLRSILIYHLRIFEDTHADFGTAARLYAHTSVHQFLDYLGIDATQQFLASERQLRRETAGLPS